LNSPLDLPNRRSLLPVAIEYIAKTSMLTLRIHRCKRIQARTCKALLRPAGGRMAAAAIVNAAALR